MLLSFARCTHVGSALIRYEDDTKSLDRVSLQDEHPGAANRERAALREEGASLSDEERR